MPTRLALADLGRFFRSGERIFLPGSAGEPAGLIDAMVADPGRTAGLDITTSAIPGINPLPLDRFDPTARITGLFMQPGFAAAQRQGRFRHLPISYSGFVRHLGEGPGFDACVLHVSPPDAAGLCSLGAAVEFTPIAAARSRRLIGIVNEAMPRVPGAETVRLDAFEAIAEIDAPLRTYEVGRPSDESQRIAAAIALLVEDGSTVQVGLGKVPEALLPLLHDRRGLRVHSGMVADSIMGLSASGALDPAYPVTTAVVVGTAALYEWLRDRGGVAVRACTATHSAAALSQIGRFVSVNSALAVDLLGQCNGETAAGAAVSGVGGAPDFARAARHSAGGVSIVALPSSYAKGTRSRIVPALGAGTVSLTRADVDVIVTEHGAADLRGRSVHERGEALIAVAAPAHRADLTAAWREIAARL